MSTPSAAASPRSPLLRPDRLRAALAPAAIFVAWLLLVSVAVPQFLGGGGPSIIAQQAVPILLIALAQCAVLQVGGIDLSNAAMALLSAILCAEWLGPLGALGPVLAVAVVTGVGALNGLVLTVAQIPSFALTLGTLGILQAAVLVITGANVAYVTAHLDAVSWLFSAQFLTLPAAFWLSIAAAALFWAFLRFTGVGGGLAAVGHNARAATLSGLPVRRLMVTAFALSGFFAGLAGVTVIAVGGAASSYGLGSDLLVPGIAAALAGGTAITGGTCNPLNVVFGAMFIALIPVGTAAMGVSTQAQSIVYGLVLIVAVAASGGSRSRSGIVK